MCVFGFILELNRSGFQDWVAKLLNWCIKFTVLSYLYFRKHQRLTLLACLKIPTCVLSMPSV